MILSGLVQCSFINDAPCGPHDSEHGPKLDTQVIAG